MNVDALWFSVGMPIQIGAVSKAMKKYRLKVKKGLNQSGHDYYRDPYTAIQYYTIFHTAPLQEM